MSHASFTLPPPPHLVFRGQCLQAFQLYAEALGGSIESMDTSGGPHQRVVHAAIQLCGQQVTGEDLPPHRAMADGNADIALLLDCASAVQARDLFELLSRQGRVTTAMTGTGWGLAGAALDRFGTPWVVRCPQRAQARPRAEHADGPLALTVLRLASVSGHGEGERTRLGPLAPLHQQAQQDQLPVGILQEGRRGLPVEIGRWR